MSKPMEYIWPGIIAAQAMHAATKLGIVPTENVIGPERLEISEIQD